MVFSCSVTSRGPCVIYASRLEPRGRQARPQIGSHVADYNQSGNCGLATRRSAFQLILCPGEGNFPPPLKLSDLETPSLASLFELGTLLVAGPFLPRISFFLSRHVYALVQTWDLRTGTWESSLPPMVINVSRFLFIFRGLVKRKSVTKCFS